MNAGAAARIRAGYGDGNRGHGLPRRASAASTTARRLVAATVGSAAKDSAEITDTPSQPAAITSAALLSLMPAMAQIGNFASRPRIACTTARRPSMPIGALASSLEVVP